MREEGRKAVGGGPLWGAGAGGAARAGGGLKGSTLMVLPQHTLRTRDKRRGCAVWDAGGC